MDVNLKRGFLDVLVLSILKKEDSYGYKIITDISKIITISESTLYPVLKRLLDSNYISSYSTEYNGRLRKYYKFLKKGDEKINEFLKDYKEIINVYNFISSKGETNDSK